MPQPDLLPLAHRPKAAERGMAQVADWRRFDAVIDARSPAEFALDHIPGAINCPALDDDERRIVGTLYKQCGAFEARRVGGAMVAANLARHLREQWASHGPQWKPLVYCWRGGLRSGSTVQWMRLVGWDAHQLAGGYKRWRQHVIECIARVAPQLHLHVVCGATGSAKTRLLHVLAAQGAQVLDLEALAAHKGSLLGAWPGRAQPSQKAFETQLAITLESLNLHRPVFVEAESRKIGRIALPTAFVERLRDSPCTEIAASFHARQQFLLRDYAYLGEDGEALARQLAPLLELHGRAVIDRWQAWAREGALAALFAELTKIHYDPAYARSQSRNFSQWPSRRIVAVESLGEADLPAIATQISALAGCAGSAQALA